MKAVAYVVIVLSYLLTTASFVSAEPAMPDSIVRVGACATPGIAWGVFVQDSFAYVADRTYLTTVDITLPASPQVRGFLDPPVGWPVGVSVKDTVAYLNNNTSDCFTDASVADADSPYVLGISVFPRGSPEPKGIQVLDSLVYLASASAGLHVLDVSDPLSPSLLSSFDTPGTAMDLFVKDTLAYIADLGSLQLVDVSVPSSPSLVATIGFPNSCYDVFVAGTYGYAPCQSSSGTDGTLQVVDVSNPVFPSTVGSVAVEGDPFAVYVSGRYAYVVTMDWWASDKGARTVGGLRPSWALKGTADVEGGIRVVDVSSPTSPVLVASYDTPGDPRDVFVVFPYIYIADYDSLQILRHVVTGVAEQPPTGQTGTDTPILLQNKPNPFSQYTTLSYKIESREYVVLEIFNLAGAAIRRLVDGDQAQGQHMVTWDGRDSELNRVAPGPYFYQLRTDRYRLTKKMLVVR